MPKIPNDTERPENTSKDFGAIIAKKPLFKGKSRLKNTSRANP